MSKKSVVSAIFLVAGAAGLVTYTAVNKAEEVEVEVVEEDYIPVIMLDGVFQCEYYKATAQHVPDVINYEVVATQSGWNWILHLKDDTSLFYTQSAGQFCYVKHVGE